VEELQDLE